MLALLNTALRELNLAHVIVRQPQETAPFQVEDGVVCRGCYDTRDVGAYDPEVAVEVDTVTVKKVF